MPTVLFVDDEPSTVGLYRLVFEAAGFAVSQVPTASAARAACLDKPPDLLVVDQGLPDGNGLDLLFELRPLAAAAILTLGTLSPTVTATARYLGVETVDKMAGPRQVLSVAWGMLSSRY
ncbi:hypothetical protein SBA3_3920005 [Candidatus Sulfopaludibacter sp. SbA3]|nr:hypothetical protein SBA3_3920005 [Candidatus Sulfopaludibacter sp. SbA3]